MQSSGTHPDDVNLHYGTQYAWGVAAGALTATGGAYAAGALWGAGSTGGSAQSVGVLTGIAAQQYGQRYQQVVEAGAQLQQYVGRLDQLSPSELARFQALYFNYLLLWNQLYGRN